MDADAFAIFAHPFKADNAGHLSEKGIVLADADIEAWVDARSTLTDQDISSQNMLAAVALNAQALRIAVSTVAGRPLRFGMCHR